MIDTQGETTYDPPELNTRQRVDTIIKRDLLLTVGRAAIGGIMGAIMATGVGGVFAAVISCAVAAGLGAFSTSHICNLRRTRLAKFYDKEIAAKLGVSDPATITEDHLKAVTQGKDGNPEIRNTEKLYKDRRNFYIGVYSVTAASMAGVLGALGGLGVISWPLLAAGAAVFYNEAFHLVEKAGNILFHAHQKTTLTATIEQIGHKISEGETVSPTQVLSMLVSTHADVADEIKRVHGKAFDELNIAQKRVLVEQYEPVLHAKAITQALMDAKINAKELAFIAYDQRSGADYEPKQAAATNAAVMAEPGRTRPDFLTNILSDTKEPQAAGQTVGTR